MNENEGVKLVTNLRLTLCPSNRCALGSSNDEFGVGANAASRADMIFVANDSLSELVWSPHKGLSIRCAVGSVTEKKSSFFWSAGSGDMVLSSPHNIGTEISHGNSAHERISVPAPTTSKDDRNMPAFQLGHNRESGSSESMNTSSRLNNVDQDDNVAVNEAIESGSPGFWSGIEDGKLRNVSPVFDDRFVHAGSAGDKLECVAENDLPPSVKLLPDSAVSVPTEQFRLEVCEISKAAPITVLASETKGKEKTIISDDDRKREASQDNEDDSYESVESCNSARQFSSGKKRVMSFNEQLIVKSKRLKMQIQETPASSSFTKSNSSFANWISAMVKGLSAPDTRNGNKVLTDTSSEEQYNKCGNMGFQSFFRSIYRPNPKVQDERLLCNDNFQKIESCKEINLAENCGEANSNPVVSNSNDLLALRDNTSKSLSQSEPFLKENVASDPLDSKTDASSKGFGLNPDSTVVRDIRSSQKFTAGKMAMDIFGKSCSEVPTAGKVVHPSVKKDDHLSSLFIAHFCPKSPRPIVNSIQQKQSPLGTEEGGASSSRLTHTSQRTAFLEHGKSVGLQGSSSEEPTNSSAFKRLHGFPVGVEADCTVKEVEAQNINQIVHFQTFQSSEAMASIFAKRLDALKNIMPTDKSASSAATCFFCGVMGHDLRYCPQLTETEVNELVTNMAAYGEKEESPCLCIRCFQLNHWAAACPNAPSQKTSKLGGENLHKKGFLRNFSLPDDIIDGQAQSHKAILPCGSIEKALSNVRKVSAAAAASEDNAPERVWLPYPCGSLSVAAGIFEVVKSLQLSRNDVMKWMNSIYSTSLDGYYLRLRQKLVDGHGGTQYHVACICSPQEEKPAETSKRPISVIVGGNRCSVECQYISNQEFLEDELKAWWSATVRGDQGKIPSEKELRLKVEERRRLSL